MKSSPRNARFSFEICILAGGLSSRMGRDKARLQLGRKTFAARIRATAKKLNIPVRTIRRDLVDRCGPLGGVFTALTTTSAEAVVFAACDMPFVSADLLQKLLIRFTENRSGKETVLALFTSDDGLPGFPFILSRDALPKVNDHLSREIFSLKALAKGLNAQFYRPTAGEKEFLFNINTPEEFAEAKRRLTLKPVDVSKTTRKARDCCKSPSRNRARPRGTP